MDLAASCPRDARWLQWLMEKNHRARLKSRDRLRALARAASDVSVFCAHDRFELDLLKSTAVVVPTDRKADLPPLPLLPRQAPVIRATSCVR